VLPEYQRHGLGRRLIEAVVTTLRARKFEALSLTVTAANRLAVTLYEKIGFRNIKTFTAGVWQSNRRT
jgi:ribosomal-protein-alanine N-acetyltransferase